MPPNDPTSSSLQAIRLAHLRILIIDDLASDRSILRLALESHDIDSAHIFEAHDGAQALQLLHDHPIDLCLSDYQLTTETALDIFTAARKAGHLMSFIGVTGAMDENRATAYFLAAGFDDVIHKDVLDRANLYRIVRNAMLRNRHVQMLEERSTVDELTGLSNRRGALLRLDIECARLQREQRPLSLLFLDLNDFKQINDRWGHAAGDRALRHVAQTIGLLLRKSDLLARMGGDEFLIVCPGAGEEQAHTLVERVRACLQVTPLKFDGRELCLSASIGLHAWNAQEGIATPESLLLQADQAMYMNKQRHRQSRLPITASA